MASDDEEPSSAKRSRSELTTNVRYIKLDMANYDSSLQKYSDEDLVKIFELGLKVKESATLSLDVNSKMVEEALESKIRPVHDSVAKIEKEVNEQVLRVQENVANAVKIHLTKFAKNVEDLKQDVSNHMTTIKDQLTNRVDTVVQKVQPLDILNSSINNSTESIKSHLHVEVQDSEYQLYQRLGECKQRLDSISDSLDKPSNKLKGDRAEKKVLEILRDNLGALNFTFRDTANDPGKGDIEAETPNGHSIMIEVKQWVNALSKDVIEKFETNLTKFSNFKVGILLSMTSGISRRSREGWFEIAFDQIRKQYQIYVPNAYANKEEHLIVWSVVMAAQLGKLDGDLGENKYAGLKEIYKKFAANVQHSKDCKSSLDNLKTSVKTLEESIKPILTTVDETKNDIYKLLYS